MGILAEERAEEGVPEAFNLGGRGFLASWQGQEVSVTQQAKESSSKENRAGRLSAPGEPRQCRGKASFPFFVFLKLLKIFKHQLTNSCQEYCEKAPGVKKLPSEWEGSAPGGPELESPGLGRWGEGTGQEEEVLAGAPPPSSDHSSL